VLVEVKKYNDRMTDTCHFIVFGLEHELNNTVLLEQEVKESNEKESVVNEFKEIKYEDKYLDNYLDFSNEYTFTEEELLAEQFTIINNKHIWKTNLNKDVDELQKQFSEVLTVFEAGSSLGLTDEVCKMMGKYFKVDETEYLATDLFNDITELNTELASQLDTLLTNKDNPDFEKDARVLTINKKLDAYINNYVLEMTPLGNVYMRYNNNKKSFEYFSNNTIPYRYLEAVGRKYVMTYWCKPLFVNLADELVKAEQKQLEEPLKLVTKHVTIVKQSFSSKNSLMNTNTNTNTNTRLETNVVTNVKAGNAVPVLLKENANRYTWEGRLSSLMLLKKAEKRTATLSFAEFKLLQKQNKEQTNV
jgi:hypothetical protein